MSDFVIENGVLTRYKGNESNVVIPDGVTEIGRSAFAHVVPGFPLKSISIPNSVTSIGDKAFYWCSDLKSITIPNSVISIGECTFFSCTSLKSITIPNSVTSIGAYVFACCKSLESITIPNSVTSIDNGAFGGCKSLKSINIPNSVTSIGVNAFSLCESLESITIPNSVTSIGEGAFDRCKSLESINIPNSVAEIGDKAFLLSGVKGIYYQGTESQWENITKRDSFDNIVIHFNYGSKEYELAKIEDEVRKLLSEGKTEKEVYATLKAKNIPASDIVGVFSKVYLNSKIVSSYCSEVILPSVLTMLSSEDGVSKYTIAEVANILYDSYPRVLVNEAIISVIGNHRIVD